MGGTQRWYLSATSLAHNTATLWAVLKGGTSVATNLGQNTAKLWGVLKGGTSVATNLGQNTGKQ